MKQVVDKDGNPIADLDEDDQIIDGHHRVVALAKLGHDLFVRDGDTITPARLVGIKVTLH
jgi:ParB-like chromosome segregation protein Spo0J